MKLLTCICAEKPENVMAKAVSDNDVEGLREDSESVFDAFEISRKGSTAYFNTLGIVNESRMPHSTENTVTKPHIFIVATTARFTEFVKSVVGGASALLSCDGELLTENKTPIITVEITLEK